MVRCVLAFFCFEKSARELVTQRLRDAHGEDWWITQVPEKIRQKIDARKSQEQRTSGSWFADLEKSRNVIAQ